MAKTTEDLSNDITNVSTIEQLKELQFHSAEDFSHPFVLEYLLETALIHGVDRKELAKIVINQSNLERAYVYHLLSGEKNMTRDKLIMFALAGRFELQEVNDLLRYAGEATLYVRKKRDAVLEFVFKKRYSIIEANLCLEEMKLEILK